MRTVLDPGWVAPWHLEQIFKGILVCAVWCTLELATKPLVIKVGNRPLLLNQVLWYLGFEDKGVILFKFLDKPLSRG